MFLFKKPKNELEPILSAAQGESPNIVAEAFIRCPDCHKSLLADTLRDHLQVCPKCGYHLKIGARDRLLALCDAGSFCERDAELESANPINFPDYEEKLTAAVERTLEREAVVTGRGKVEGLPCCLFAMDGTFMMGSMGCVVGEKITRLFEYAEAQSLPVVGFTLSGGARMQEGILSLMQMAKTSGAVKAHSDAGLLYITVLTNPTTGGVTASFAMEGDIILAEPGALICFAGPRVIEQTTRQKLPQGFQRAEFLLEKGFVDAIVPREEHRSMLGRLLAFHRRGAAV
ncbi:acetyl-CoA carboxylase, beta (carboxyltranferase) subunit [uncultured Eubacteriales bacterium]|uniref:Acetyl-coenzyme A carboxylase carboxyl transferase subunit beta n=1 Tax=uncultured Eubacteriales bacterium TaxID=172733 RepID=A0A212KA60_9FIRM|nr:acetyl-CoA carboxylase, beta (carboxyltranferase) subunit [uncultured Eubacteriales bacterium]